jgi:hypothetical protein
MKLSLNLLCILASNWAYFGPFMLNFELSLKSPYMKDLQNLEWDGFI